MEKLSDSIERKFVDVIDIDDYEVLTDDGWHDIKSVNKTIEYKIYELKTKNFSLKCADTHIVFDQDMNEIFVKDLRPGQSIMTEIGLDEVVSVIDLNESDNMYDLSLGDES